MRWRWRSRRRQDSAVSRQPGGSMTRDELDQEVVDLALEAAGGEGHHRAAVARLRLQALDYGVQARAHESGSTHYRHAAARLRRAADLLLKQHADTEDADHDETLDEMPKDHR